MADEAVDFVLLGHLFFKNISLGCKDCDYSIMLHGCTPVKHWDLGNCKSP